MINQLILEILKNKRIALLKILAIIIVIIIFTIILYLQYNKKENWINIHHNKDLTVSDILYYNVVTFFTVGFGDQVPASTSTRVLTMCMIVISYIITIM